MSDRLRALVALSCVALAGCRVWDRRPDVVLIVLDAARADHLSCYGYERPTTPHLDRLAAEGVLYQRAIAPATWTVPSHASLFTGRLPTAHGAYHAPDGPNAVSGLASDVETLAERLAAAGYDTAAFVGNDGYLDARFGFSRGFGLYRTDDVRPAERLAHHVTRWLRRKAGRPAFVFMNIMETHEPYRARPPYDRLFPGRLDDDPGDVNARYLGTRRLPEPEVIRHCVSQYDGELRYVDDQLASIFDQLRELGRYDNALIVVTADHGEMFGEHGALGHSGRPYHTVLWVPLIVRYPQASRRGVEQRPVSLIDVAPTILAMLDLPPLAGATGAPLWAPSRPVVAEEIAATGATERAVYGEDGHVLLRLDEGGSPRSELYDLGADPAQSRPLAASEHPSGRRLEADLAALVSTMPAAARGQIVRPDERLLGRLRALGYVQ